MVKFGILRQLWQKMGLLFLAFFVLVTASVSVTSWMLNSQKEDALVINLAGRQRMLLQQMTKDTLQLNYYLVNPVPDPDEIEAHRTSLVESTTTFDKTLSAFINGGYAPYLPGLMVQLPKTGTPEILSGLRTVQQSWNTFREQIEIVQSSDSIQDAQLATERVEQLSPVLVQQADDVVRLFESASDQKITRLRRIQFVFFAAALILLLFGGWATAREILSPLNQLKKAAIRISEGDLDTAISVSGPQEMQILAENFEAMRRQIKRARENLETRVAQRTREIGVAFELSHEIVTELTLEKTLSLVVNRAKTLANAETAVLCLLSPSGKTLNMAAFSSETSPKPDIDVQTVNRGVPVTVLKTARPVTTDVICADCRFLSHQTGVCTATPLRAGETTLGALCVVRPESRQFDTDEVRALSSLANSAAIAINNARLIQTEREQTKQTAILTERNRLAAELHDNLAQTLSFLNLKTDRLFDMLVENDPDSARAELLQMKNAIQTAYQQVRAALVELQEPTSPLGDLTDDLAACLHDFERETRIPAVLNVIASDPVLVTRAIHTQVLHVVREALVNVRRHAHADYVAVELAYNSRELCITIQDDGDGFDLNTVTGSNHLGLTIMHTRVERSGGVLEIETAPNQGTRIIARFPVKTDTQPVQNTV